MEFQSTERQRAMLRDIFSAPAPSDGPVCEPALAFVILAILIGLSIVIAALLCCPGSADAVWAYFEGGR